LKIHRKDFNIGSSYGLYLFDPNAGSATKIWPSGSRGYMVPFIYEDTKGELWVATKGRGVLRYSAERVLKASYTVNNGLPNDVINTIVEDDHGFLWLSTNKGICKFDPVTEEIRSYDYGDGLQGNEFNTNSGIKSKNGLIYFGGVNGLNYFYPNQIQDNLCIPQVLLTNLKISNQQVGIGEEKSPLKTNISISKELNLKIRSIGFYIRIRCAELHISW
jgi:hypothetical protein